MKIPEKFSKKEKLMFWSGLSVGIIGGVVGNLWVGSYFDWTNNFFDTIKFVTFILFSLILIGIIFFIKHRINKIMEMTK